MENSVKGISNQQDLANGDQVKAYTSKDVRQHIYIISQQGHSKKNMLALQVGRVTFCENTTGQDKGENGSNLFGVSHVYCRAAVSLCK